MIDDLETLKKAWAWFTQERVLHIMGIVLGGILSAIAPIVLLPTDGARTSKRVKTLMILVGWLFPANLLAGFTAFALSKGRYGDYIAFVIGLVVSMIGGSVALGVLSAVFKRQAMIGEKVIDKVIDRFTGGTRD